MASGRGSNFTACVEAIRKKKLPIQILALVSDNPGAKALESAKSFQIPTKVLDFAKYEPKRPTTRICSSIWRNSRRTLL